MKVETSKQEFVTQGGGIVVYDRFQKAHVFTVPPKWGTWKAGDFMPDEWGIIPITKEFRKE